MAGNKVATTATPTLNAGRYWIAYATSGSALQYINMGQDTGRYSIDPFKFVSLRTPTWMDEAVQEHTRPACIPFLG